MDEPAKLPRLRTTAAIRSTCPRGRRSAWSARRASTSGRAIPTASVPEGKVTATFAGKNDPWKGLDAFTSHGNGMPLNWHNQGRDAGLYDNGEIHAVRILAMEPTTDRNAANNGRQFYSHAMRTAADSRRVPAAEVRGQGWRRAARSRRQSRYEFPRQDSRRSGLHVSDARQERHGC